MPDFSAVQSPFLLAFGITAALIFYGRFYLQWIVSEIKKRSVMPVGFWYMSGVGSFMLLIFGAATHSPNGTFSHGFNSVIYARNLVLVWREKGVLTRRRQFLIYGAAGVMVSFAFCLVAYAWMMEIKHVQDQKHWVWVGVGGVAQLMFAGRFLIQWAVSEVKKKSVVPVAFWHLSLWASVLLLSSHAHQQEWVYAGGLAATVPVYLRNLWLVHHHREVKA